MVLHVAEEEGHQDSGGGCSGGGRVEERNQVTSSKDVRQPGCARVTALRAFFEAGHEL